MIEVTYYQKRALEDLQLIWPLDYPQDITQLDRNIIFEVRDGQKIWRYEIDKNGNVATSSRRVGTRYVK